VTDTAIAARGRGSSRLRHLPFGRAPRRALIAYVAALAIWQIGASSGHWLGHRLPIIGNVPTPLAVLQVWAAVIVDPGYWQSWYLSVLRVLTGFSAAVMLGVPFGLLLATSRVFRGIAFPVFELLRPIPPLAWVPAAIIFWPTQELSIDFVIFVGAFFTLVINVVDGAKTIDARFIEAARSMGGSQWNIFRRVILPGVLPSIRVGMEVGIGITWEVVVAAEMISGGGSGGSAASGGGLGFFIWNSYVGGSYPQIVIGMISIGVAGYVSSAAVRWLEAWLTPWLRVR
jgi:NitT/TauT family transport system permease protein